MCWFLPYINVNIRYTCVPSLLSPSPGEEGRAGPGGGLRRPHCRPQGVFSNCAEKGVTSVQVPPRRPLETELTSKGPDSKPSVTPDPSPHPWGLPPSLRGGMGSLSFQGPRPRLGSVWRGHSPLNRDPELERHWKEGALAVCSTSPKAAPLPPSRRARARPGPCRPQHSVPSGLFLGYRSFR